MITTHFAPTSVDSTSPTTDVESRALNLASGSADVDLVMPCSAEETYSTTYKPLSVVVLTAAEPQLAKRTLSHSITIVKMPGRSLAQQNLAQSLRRCLRTFGCMDVEVAEWEEISRWDISLLSNQDLHFICLNQVGSAPVTGPGGDVFVALKYLVAMSKSILWISTTVKDEKTFEGIE